MSDENAIALNEGDASAAEVLEKSVMETNSADQYLEQVPGVMSEKSEMKKSTWSTGNISEPKLIYDEKEAKSSSNTNILVGNNAESTSVRGSIALNSTGMMSVDSLNFADSLKTINQD